MNFRIFRSGICISISWFRSTFMKRIIFNYQFIPCQFLIKSQIGMFSIYIILYISIYRISVLFPRLPSCIFYRLTNSWRYILSIFNLTFNPDKSIQLINLINFHNFNYIFLLNTNNRMINAQIHMSLNYLLLSIIRFGNGSLSNSVQIGALLRKKDVLFK